MQLPTIPNYGILKPIPSDPAGFVTKDGLWAAVPIQNKFAILHKGEQVHVANNYKTAKSYISKQIKLSKKSTSSIDKFLK